MIIDPSGAILAEAGEGEQLRTVSLDLPSQQLLREKFSTVAPAHYAFDDKDKIVSLAHCVPMVECRKKLGQRIVFTNGCFDILHAGHVEYLQEARRQGDFLVGLNSDHSVRSIKGESRPINQELQRARVLAALGCVDAVVLFSEDTPLKLITTLLPQVLVKGADWPEEAIVGAREVKANGGK
ncbi:adenylyltransferase/cytidyltransferase family protein, partial [bacterium]|nr:adenylyltransferase/cytidyltransferase family protein [bacterium]